MKKFLNICILIATLTNVQAKTTTYNVTANSTYSANGIPSQCTNCIINIANGVTLTLDQDIFLQNVTFNGGTISTDTKNITFWSAGAFNNVTVNFNQSAGIINSGALTITGSTFNFYNNAYATVYTSISLISSAWNFDGNSHMESTGGTFSLSKSFVTVGDGSASSKAYAKFNGGNFSILDNVSFLTILSNSNYYFNWSAYKANSKSIKNNNAPYIYGTATLSAGGTSSNAMLPVKLSAFAVKVTGTTVSLAWTTDQEMNSAFYAIERSVDGANWTVIGKVNAQGTTSIATKYSFVDASPVSGAIQYRLKMVDIDGNFEYSPIKAVKIEAAETHQMSIYPNPATEYVVISSKGGVAANTKIQLISMNGQVLKQVNGNAANVNLSVSEFRSGNYIVRVTDAAGAAQSFKLLISK